MSNERQFERLIELAELQYGLLAAVDTRLSVIEQTCARPPANRLPIPDNVSIQHAVTLERERLWSGLKAILDGQRSGGGAWIDDSLGDREAIEIAAAELFERKGGA